MTTTIGLIRQGITEWNILGKAQGRSDIREEIKQATALAHRLSIEEWDIIFSSNLIRAKQTASFPATFGNIDFPILDVLPKNSKKIQ
ncbi:histidine phosphatase family protein [Paenibacillus jamilae]|uniref:histidine phosphatase family protein n=1 Tax=Paenibacillus alvei TaxID=44250 RepID=UPI002E0EF142